MLRQAAAAFALGADVAQQLQQLAAPAAPLVFIDGQRVPTVRCQRPRADELVEGVVIS